MHRSRNDGFAVVELLLALLVMSIIVAVCVMAISNVNEDGGKSCRTEGREFAVAVDAYHRSHGNKAWPDENASGSVQRTADALTLNGARPTLDHLDGSLRVPVDNKRGWTYDFERHTTNSLGCD